MVSPDIHFLSFQESLGDFPDSHLVPTITTDIFEGPSGPTQEGRHSQGGTMFFIAMVWGKYSGCSFFSQPGCSISEAKGIF